MQLKVECSNLGEPVAQVILLGLLIQWSRVRFPGKPVGG